MNHFLQVISSCWKSPFIWSC